VRFDVGEVREYGDGVHDECGHIIYVVLKCTQFHATVLFLYVEKLTAGAHVGVHKNYRLNEPLFTHSELIVLGTA